jgi:MFS transporter, FSR family, fosmidomycin resistance protein
MNPASTSTVQPKAYIAVLLVLGSTHLLNDLIQSLIPAIYPIIKDKYALDFVQIGVITLTFQIAGSLLQPLVGHYTDQHPMPYATAIGMIFTLVGLLSLAFSTSHTTILISVAFIGIGSSVYHPEATRMARYASGNQQGLAQGIFQVGGQIGGALSPLLAALIIVPRGQTTLSFRNVGSFGHGADDRDRSPTHNHPSAGCTEGLAGSCAKVFYFVVARKIPNRLYRLSK